MFGKYIIGMALKQTKHKNNNNQTLFPLNKQNINRNIQNKEITLERTSNANPLLHIFWKYLPRYGVYHQSCTLKSIGLQKNNNIYYYFIYTVQRKKFKGPKWSQVIEKNVAHIIMKWQETQYQYSSHWMWNYINFSSTRSLVSSFQLDFKTYH